ncbi:MAG: hypothetical protein NZ889_02150 [Candidatus Pacearchaeota archaeon]|nr:hypothetical protein [Candidatus Pacearchaeota archaeon]
MRKKAQVWALDLAISLIVFVGIIFIFYRYSVSFAPEQITLQKMIKEGGMISENLLSEGYPPDWNEKTIDKVYMFGFLTNNLLNESKWSKFCEWSNDETLYPKVKKKVGTEFAFYIVFDKDSNGVLRMGGWEEIQNCDQAGKIPPENAAQIVKIERLIAYKSEGRIIPMKMILFLWSYSKT